MLFCGPSPAVAPPPTVVVALPTDIGYATSGSRMTIFVAVLSTAMRKR